MAFDVSMLVPFVLLGFHLREELLRLARMETQRLLTTQLSCRIVWPALFSLMGLASCTSVPPAIPMLPKAESVKVLQPTPDIPRQCTSLGRLSESDGQAEGSGRYNGTDQRALLRLKNDAASQGANVIVLLDMHDPKNRDVLVAEVYFDCGRCKSVALVTVDAYSCPERAE